MPERKAVGSRIQSKDIQAKRSLSSSFSASSIAIHFFGFYFECIWNGIVEKGVKQIQTKVCLESTHICIKMNGILRHLV